MDTHQWDFAYDALTGEEVEPDAIQAFESVHAAAIDEIAPAVASLLADAINRRLPWTWEPDR